MREIVVGAPLELFDALRRFYTHIMGLKPWDDDRQFPGTWGLGDERCGLLLEFRHDPEIDAMKRRFTVVVGDLPGLQERLTELECSYRRIHGFGSTDHYILFRDPAGHLIEARQSQPL